MQSRPWAQVRSAEPRHESRRPAEFHAAIPVSIHERALPGCDLAERVHAAVRLGWTAIGLQRKTIWEFGSERVIELLADSGLSVSTLSWTGGYTGTAGFSYREAIEDGRQALEEAVQVGAKTLLVAPGARGGHTFRHAHRVIVDGLRYLSEIAARRGVALAVIVSPSHRQLARWTNIDTLETAHQLLEQVDSHWVGVCAPLHKLAGQPATESCFNTLAPRIRLITSFIDVQSEADRSSPPVRPLVPHAETLGKLRARGFCGQWEIDIPPARTAPLKASPEFYAASYTQFSNTDELA